MRARWGTARRAEPTNRHSETFYNYLCRLLLRLTNCHSEAFFNTLCRFMVNIPSRHSEALAEESLKLSNSYRDSSVVSLLQNDRGKCISLPDGVRGGTSRRVELTSCHSEAFFNTLCKLLLRLTSCHSEAFYKYLCRLLLRLTNCHSEALAEESLKLSNSYRDSSVVSLLQNDRCKCISPPDGGARGGTSRRVELTSCHSEAFLYLPII